ncbi:translocation/assembly module TamB [Dokdonia sinensis]|uniref:Translocation/assembly module TamB n=1 Tax=Dokdonia sinensis TaxID=2479847 RepID=A0A3M0GHA1_9FLAO|nr:translocation/assembly module TamB domain-containing protein [Dokdonia sinensis]RMB63937.1 translocation/assembly module TamB [Dokdonia sinensis]
MNKPQTKKKKAYKWLRILGKVVLVFLVLFLLLVLAIRSEWGQNIIVNKATSYVSNKTNTRVEIERLFLTFDGNLQIEGLYLEDTAGDTLIYSNSLEASVELMPLIKGTKYHLKSATWDGLVAKIEKDSISEQFNYQFLMDAFATADTTAVAKEQTTNPEIEIGTLDFSNFDIEFNDYTGEIVSSFKIGKLNLEMDKLDLENMRFTAGDLTLSNTQVKVTQLPPTVVSDTTESALPYFEVGDLNITNFDLDFSSKVDNIDFEGFFPEIEGSEMAITLSDQRYEANSLFLKDAVMAFEGISTENTNTTPVAGEEQLIPWPPLAVKGNSFIFENVAFSSKIGTTPNVPGVFNPENLQLTAINLKAQDINYEPENVLINLQEVSFTDRSGFKVNRLETDFKWDKNKLSARGLYAGVNSSYISGDINLDYPSFNALINKPEIVRVAIDLPEASVDLTTAFQFQPDLRKNEYFSTLSRKRINTNLKLQGTLQQLQIDPSNASWGQTKIALNGTIENPTDVENLGLYLPSLTASTTREDLLQFVNEDSLGIKLPATMRLAGNVRGAMDDLKAKATLTIPEGVVIVDGTFKNQNDIAFDTKIAVQELQLGKILQNEKIGTLTFNAMARGSGSNVNTLDVVLDSQFEKLEYAGYDFSALKLRGNIKNGKGDIDLDFKDENLDLVMNTKVKLDSVNPAFDVDLNLKGADLEKLGITQENIKAKFKLDATFIGNAERFNVESHITEGLAVYGNEPYYLGDITLDARIRQDSTDVQFKSQIINADLKSNVSPQALATALQRKFKSYVTDSTYMDTLVNPASMELKLYARQTTLLSEVLLPGLDRLDSISGNIQFDEGAGTLVADIEAPYIKYGSSIIDSVYVHLKGDEKNLVFESGLANLTAGPLAMQRTFLDGSVSDQTLFLDFNAYQGEERLAHIQSETRSENDTIVFHINPKDLIFNKKEWEIGASNKMRLAENHIRFEDFTLSRNAQRFEVSSSVAGRDKYHIGLLFENFKLSTLTSLLNPEEPLVNGLAQGSFIVEDPFMDAGIVADVTVNDFKAATVPLGTMTVKAAQNLSGKYDMAVAVKGDNVDVDLKGDYVASAEGAALNLLLDINKVKMKVVEGFLDESIAQTEGSLSGKIKIDGIPNAPDYKGTINFNNASLLVNAFNSTFKLPEEQIKVDNSGIYLNQFTIKDGADNSFIVDGGILTEDIANPKFNLTLKANDFQALNSTAEDYDFFYGKVAVTADLAITGDLNIPKVRGSMKVNEGSNFTMTVPESQLDVQEREGVVIFVNKENPDDIMTRKDDEVANATLTGYDVDVTARVDKNSTLKIIIDERSGDNFQVSGSGDFQAGLEPNGRTTLSGRYTVDDGHYEASLYGLVKRRFRIAPGSTITWQGDPLDASMDVRAIYELETSASGLMAVRTAGESTGITNKYQQKLNFLVYLNVDGELLSPDISFALDMPEDEQGQLGGEVYGQVQQLNNQEDELNKQVFSLLVLNRFFPGSGSDGSAGGPASIARDNVNNVLAGQLNNFSDKLIGGTGVKLDFGLDSYTDYQGDAPQSRTQLDISASKKLLNDRLIVQVGSAVDLEGSSQASGEGAPVIGNVSLEYLLTENGRYRLKGFRRNEFESVIDGQLIVTGIALIFNREFNKFSELFRKPIVEEVEKTEAQKEKEEQKEKEKKADDWEKDGDN